MAMIKCPECGKEISDKSPKCIYCGCPADFFNTTNENTKMDTNVSEKKDEIVGEDISSEQGKNMEQIDEASMALSGNADCIDIKEEKNEKLKESDYEVLPAEVINVTDSASGGTKKYKKIIGVTIALVAGFWLIVAIGSIGPSPEAQKVINEINELGEITVDSYSEISQVMDDYNNLSSKDQEDVDNIDLLNDAIDVYNESRINDLDNRISKACSAEITADSYVTLKKLKDEYLDLGDDEKEKISNSSELDEMLLEAQEKYAEKKASDIMGQAFYNITSAKSEFDTYTDIMSDEQKKNCLIEMAKWDSLTKAENYFKNYLKSPSSYTRYDYSCSDPYLQDDGSYRTIVDLEYGATNSFNAEVRNTTSVYVYFTLDSELTKYTFSNVKLSPLYAFKYAS